MRTLALTAALATALAGTGCIAPCNDATLTVDWSFTDVNGVAGRTCGQVGVDFVDVFVGTDRVVSAAPCLDYGAILVNVAPGSHRVVVEGLQQQPDRSLVIIDRDVFTANVGSCNDSRYTAQPGETMLQLAYTFDPVNACVSGGALWYSLFDLEANQTISAVTSGSGNPALFTCPATIQFPVPFGSYRLDWIQQVQFSGSPGRYVAIDQICSPTIFDVTLSDAVTSGGRTVPLALPAATSTCAQPGAAAL